MFSVRRLLQLPLTLRGTSPAKRPTRAAAERTAAKKRRLAASVQMEADLTWLLDQHASTRHLMRHLEFTERALQRRGVSGLERLPVRVIAKALAELESLVRDWSATGLADLRSRMAVMLKNRSTEEALESRPFGATQGAIVTEVEHSIFEESQRQWSSDDEADATGFALDRRALRHQLGRGEVDGALGNLQPRGEESRDAQALPADELEQALSAAHDWMSSPAWLA